MILDGNFTAKKLKDEIRGIRSESGEKIGLVVIQVGDDPASDIYVRKKKNACEDVGFLFTHKKLDKDVTEEELLDIIDYYNSDDKIHGILVQLPLPEHINKRTVMNKINPKKDVDGFTDVNAGKLFSGADGIVPCTAAGIIILLDEYGIDLTGKHCVIVGRSDIVGKPIAACMLHCDATITVCHSHTKNLKEICRQADVLVCAIGKPKYFDRSYIKDGAIVVDVGIHRDENGKLCGDVNFDDVKDIAGAITPVPGGVGPMTVATLLANCAIAADGMFSNT